MKLTLFVLAAVIALSPAHVSAKVISFPADNFSLDAPVGWAPVPLPPLPKECHVITAARNPASGNVYVVMTTDLPSLGSPNAFLAGMLKPLTAQGLKASPFRDETIDGKPFVVFTMSRENSVPVMLMATTFTDKRAYAVQTVAPNGDVEKTPELAAIVQSFHFLQPVQSINRHDAPTTSAASQIGYLVGRSIGFLGGIVVVVVVILAIRKTKASK